MTKSAPQLLVGGRWVRTERQLEVIYPYTGEAFASVPLGDRQLVDEAIAAAAAAFAEVRGIPAHRRAALLQKVARGIEARRPEFVETIVAESGKPVTFAEAEVARAVMTFE